MNLKKIIPESLTTHDSVKTFFSENYLLKKVPET
jgi:hypothetical protein